MKATGLQPKRTSVQSPWQNSLAERWVGSCRREMLDHVIALNEAHLRLLMSAYVKYYHEDRIHDSLEKDTPHRRPVEPKPAGKASLVCMPRVGRYTASLHVARSGISGSTSIDRNREHQALNGSPAARATTLAARSCRGFPDGSDAWPYPAACI